MRGRVGVGVDVLVDAVEHVLPVAGQRQLEQEPGEAAAGLDHRDQAAAGDVEPLEGALEVLRGLVHEPVVGEVAELGVVRQDAVEVAGGAEHPGAELLLVGAQPQHQVVERAGHRERPVVDALREHRGRVGGRRRRSGRAR